MAVKKTNKRKSSPKTTKPVHDAHISEPALKLIDKTANLLKKAVIKGEKETIAGRKIAKQKALTFLDLANERLTKAIKEGTGLAKKGVRKI
jgi:4'-phosphopantetheinyl transferase EntD